MKTVLLFLLLSPCIAIAQKPFEGIITFKVTTVVKPHITDDAYIDYYQNKYGDSIKIYYSKDGMQAKQYFGKSEAGFEWRIYDSRKNIEYAKWKGIDTIYRSDAGVPFGELRSISDGPVDTVLGKLANSVTVTTYDPVGDETMTITYFYSGEETITPGVYSKIRDGWVNEVYERSGSHFIKFIMDLLPFVVTMEAMRIEPGKVDPRNFLIPQELPQKNL